MRANTSRREWLQRAAIVATALVSAPGSLVANFSQTRPSSRSRWLLFTKSAGFEHDVIQRKGSESSILGRNLVPLFESRGIELIESKDGRLFEPSAIKGFDGFVFYTTGDLTTEGTDKHPPMSQAGYDGLLDTVKSGVPFIGLHCASDTFHGDDGPSPFTKMLGGEFEAHGEQQPATVLPIDTNFPPGKKEDWTFTEEWYAFKWLADDNHVLQQLDTTGLRGAMYERPAYPITWTRTYGNGRVFYTGIGHREDVIASAPYQQLIGAAIDWCLEKSG